MAPAITAWAGGPAGPGPRGWGPTPSARVGHMGGERAGVVLSRVRGRSQTKALSEAEAATLRAEMQAQYERQSTAQYASARLWDDGIIDPVDTRAVLGAGLRGGG